MVIFGRERAISRRRLRSAGAQIGRFDSSPLSLLPPQRLSRSPTATGHHHSPSNSLSIAFSMHSALKYAFSPIFPCFSGTLRVARRSLLLLT